MSLEGTKMARQTKEEKLTDARINAAYTETCCGIQIDIMDIGKIFNVGKVAVQSGETDEQLKVTIRNYVETIRKN